MEHLLGLQLSLNEKIEGDAAAKKNLLQAGVSIFTLQKITKLPEGTEKIAG